LEQKSGFFFEHEKCESLQGSHATQQVGGIVEKIEVHIGFAAGGEDSATQPLPGLRGFGIAGIIPIHQIIAKHQAEVTGMIENEGLSRTQGRQETERSHAGECNLGNLVNKIVPDCFSLSKSDTGKRCSPMFHRLKIAQLRRFMPTAIGKSNPE
jgi:hypothetical protein